MATVFALPSFVVEIRTPGLAVIKSRDILEIYKLDVDPRRQGCGVGVSGVACFQLESESGVGFQNCWSRESVFQNCWSWSQESEHLLQLPTPMFIK